MLQNKNEKYLSIYNQMEEEFNINEANLYKKGVKPYKTTFENFIDQTIYKMKLFYNYLTYQQSLENKKTYLITITDTKNLCFVSKFIKDLNDLSKTKKFERLKYDYFAIVEPTKEWQPHIHIKLVIDKRTGLRKKIEELLKKHTKSYANIKFQNKTDTKQYLLKALCADNFKEYIGWLSTIGINLSKAFKKSQKLYINEKFSILLDDYYNVLKFIINKQKNEDQTNLPKFIDFKKVKEYILSIEHSLNNEYSLQKQKHDNTYKNKLKKLMLEYDLINVSHVDFLYSRLKKIKKKSAEYVSILEELATEFGFKSISQLRLFEKHFEKIKNESHLSFTEVFNAVQNKSHKLIKSFFKELLAYKLFLYILKESPKIFLIYINQVALLILIEKYIDFRANSPNDK